MVRSQSSAQFSPIPELIEGLPNICGWEAEVQSVVSHADPVFLPTTNLDLGQIQAAFAIALQMHQPTIPAETGGKLISNLQYMFEHPYEGDNYNAGPFSYCYARMADFIPELVGQGYNPRAMLVYSGNLLWGLRQIGRGEILEKLKRITQDATYQLYVEWLGTMWSHALVPTTPVVDLEPQIRAWQHHFAAVFGWEALARIRGFAPPELSLPTHPEQLYAFLKALKNCGYRWLMVQASSVETLAGEAIQDIHLPHCLVARNEAGASISLPVLLTPRGSDSHKFVGQMQPYQVAKSLSPQVQNGISIPPLVAQIADGENSGIMMNEFPNAFRRVWQECAQDNNGQSGVVGINGTEYLELLEAAGFTSDHYPTCQAKGHFQIWRQLDDPSSPAESVAIAVKRIQQSSPEFQLDPVAVPSLEQRPYTTQSNGGDDTAPIYQLSRRFHTLMDSLQTEAEANSTDDPLTRQSRYRRALLHNLLLQTSCFRYWGQGIWTERAKDIYARGESILRTDF